MKILAIIVSAATFAICCNECIAQLKDVPSYPLTAIAQFGTGGWSEISKREGPKIFKQRMPQIVIFTKRGDDEVFQLAKRVDELVENQEWGKWCALVICHQNAPTPSIEQWQEQAESLNSKVVENRLSAVSVGLWKRFPETLSKTRAHRRFDGFNEYDVAVFFRDLNRKTQYMELLNANQIDDETLDRIENQLKALVASVPDVNPKDEPTE
ncbi:hypothetical protein OAG71_04455 [bacterium]|nr:hypothetical protein [bacterium]